MLKRLAVIFVISAVSFSAAAWWTTTYTTDIEPPVCSARRMLAGLDPYGGCAFKNASGADLAQYPLTTILAFIPFAQIPDPFAEAAVWACANGLLAWGILRSGKPWRFLVFLSAPYAVAFMLLQFSPLIAAIMLLPSLLPLALLKPQTGLPIILTHLTPRRALACAAFVALTFTIHPGWPLTWWASARTYDGVIPLLVLPLGPLMLLALLRPRSRAAWVLFLYACIPQRGIYDLTPLMLLARNKAQLYALVFLSWVPVFFMCAGVNLYSMHLLLLFVYMPILAIQIAPLLRHNRDRLIAPKDQPRTLGKLVS